MGTLGSQTRYTHLLLSSGLPVSVQMPACLDTALAGLAVAGLGMPEAGGSTVIALCPAREFFPRLFRSKMFLTLTPNPNPNPNPNPKPNVNPNLNPKPNPNSWTGTCVEKIFRIRRRRHRERQISKVLKTGVCGAFPLCLYRHGRLWTTRIHSSVILKC